MYFVGSVIVIAFFTFSYTFFFKIKKYIYSKKCSWYNTKNNTNFTCKYILKM
ncbi:hypothetical protein Ccel_0238 [Ruminiclostridium cellulolyticum H10]|uniref:Uncharacterized protein n=1 Tax=Ruminiclostridium cellulolyticum (strain ATCC 35319 / DSM 5812 / JCM 6584 / H10) TaxID=394503 RepID=B8I545_RUMCH|nr:hypothetical protein Ccel_0238 [Ruminiclostridium cellulolyticum H10]